MCLSFWFFVPWVPAQLSITVKNKQKILFSLTFISNHRSTHAVEHIVSDTFLTLPYIILETTSRKLPFFCFIYALFDFFHPHFFGFCSLWTRNLIKCALMAEMCEHMKRESFNKNHVPSPYFFRYLSILLKLFLASLSSWPFSRYLLSCFFFSWFMNVRWVMMNMKYGYEM